MNLANVASRLDKGWNFTLNDKHEIVDDGIFTRIGKAFSRSVCTEKAVPIAKSLASHIEKEKRVKPHDARNENTSLESLRIARIFRKNVITKCNSNHPEFIALEEEERAAALGISTATLRSNPGKETHLNPDDKNSKTIKVDFNEYSRKTALDASLSYQEHELTPGENNSLKIKLNGEDKRWDDPEVQRLAYNTLHSSIKPDYAKICYSLNGMTLENMFEGTEPKLYSTRKAPPGQYLLGAHAHAPRPGVVDNHVWWTLLSDQGEYCISHFRPEGTNFTCGVVPAIRAVKDSSQSFRGYERETQYFDIGKEKWDLIWEREKGIFERQNQPEKKPEPFQNQTQNCTHALVETLQLAGIEVPPFKVCSWRVVAPQWIVRPIRAVYKILPFFIQWILYKIICFIGAVVMYFCGGSRKDPIFKNNAAVQPPIQSFGDLFRSKTMEMYSPFYFKKKVLLKLKRWRQEDWKTRQYAVPSVIEWQKYKKSYKAGV